MSNFIVTLAITNQKIMDTLDAAFYSGIGYWGRILGARLASGTALQGSNAAYPWAVVNDGSVSIFIDDEGCEADESGRVIAFREHNGDDQAPEYCESAESFCKRYDVQLETIGAMVEIYGHDPFLFDVPGGPSFEIEYVGEGCVKHLNRAAIEKGLAFLATDATSHLIDIVNETGDAITGDMLVQASLFQALRFG